MHNHLLEDPKYILRAATGYFLALLAVRIMGKRSIGELGAFDLVLMIGVGNILSMLALEKKVPFHDGILVLSTLTIIEVSTAIISYRSKRMSKLIGGTPRYLIKEGKILKESLKKEKLTKDDLNKELRKQGVDKNNDVEKAIIEACGKFSVIKKASEEPLRRKDLGILRDGDRPMYLDKKFAEVKNEIDMLNTALNNLIIEVRKLKDEE